MQNLVKLFSILQLTKEQPLTGYLIAGLKLSEVPTLAEHHYSCALMGYLLSEKIKKANGQINELKLIKMLLVHDLSELFGGDIAGPLHRKYPDLGICKDKIGERAMDLLSGYMDKDTGEEFNKLFEEFEHGESDEKYVAKTIDQMDHQFFFEHHNQNLKYFHDENSDYRNDFVNNHVFNICEKIKDENTKKIMTEFVQIFSQNFFKKGYKAVSLLME